MQRKEIPIVMICDKNFIMQTKVALASMKYNKKKSTIYDVYILLVDLEENEAESIQQMNAFDFKINIRSVTIEEYKNIKQIAHVPLASLIKFDICDLITEYDKLLYLDGDIIVKNDLTELYNTELFDNYIAGVPHSLGIITGERKLNGGVLLFNAKKIRQEKLRRIFVETRQSLGERKSMDQETFHIVFGEKKLYLNPRYNIMIDKIEYEKKYYSIKSYNEFFNTCYKSRKDIVEKATIIHYTGAIKPWEYKFAPGAEVWYKYYLLTYGRDNELKRADSISYFMTLIKKSGIRSIYWYVKDKVLGFLGETLGIFLEKKHGEWN